MVNYAFESGAQKDLRDLLQLLLFVMVNEMWTIQHRKACKN